MPAVVSRRLVAGAIATRLQAVTHATGYFAQVGRTLDGTLGVDPQPKSADDQRISPYFVFYPGAGLDGPDPDLGGCAVDLTSNYQVTAVAGDIDDLLALVDRIDGLLHRWTPTVAGYASSRLERPPGFDPRVLTDRAVSPERLFVPLPYVHTTTA